MSADFRYNISEPFKSGIDFYGLPIPQGASVVEITSDVTTVAQKIAYAVIDIQANSFTVTLGQEIQKAVVDIQITSDVTVVARKIQFASTTISGDGSVVSISEKDAYGTVSISTTSNVQVQGTEILYASAAPSGEITTSFTATEIVHASVSISAFTVVVTAGKEILYAKANISMPVTSVLATGIKFAVNDVPDTSNYRVLFVLDDKPLTNQGRTLNGDQSMIFVENKNWNNRKSRYYKRSNSAGRNSFVLSWTFLPNSRYDTIDRRYARDYIKQLASDPDVHTLKVINNDFNAQNPYTETEYNVFIRDYSETLVRRDLQSDVYYWDCSLTLEEV